MENTKIKKEPLIHISRRNNLTKKQSFFIKLGTILFALLFCGIFSTIVKPGSFGDFYLYMLQGGFQSVNSVLYLLWQVALLFLIAIALVPAFKMKFWNIGAEGQVLMGGLCALIIMKFLPGYLPNWLLIIVMFIAAIIGGTIWGVIPAIFKAFFNTNETLFTLMMNYIAMGLVAFFNAIWKATGKTDMGVINNYGSEYELAGWLPKVFGYDYIIPIIIVIVIGVVVWAYLKFSKHGYELAVVGESENTARYVGINVKKVIIRTMVLSGALCGVAGFLIVSGAAHTLKDSTVGGKGFTGVLVAWLGAFDPLKMLIYSFFVSFISLGANNAAAFLGYSAEIAGIMQALFFLFLIASEFFINFELHFRKKETDENSGNDPNAPPKKIPFFKFEFLKRKKEAQEAKNAEGGK